MAEIVRGFASSHGPLLILPPESWPLRADFDRNKEYHDFRGGTYNFEELVALRKGEQDFEKVITPEACADHFQRCQTQLDALGDMMLEVDPDILIVVGDDQNEWFHNDVQPAFTVFCGEAILNSGYDAEKEKDKHPSIQLVESQRHTPVDTYYDCVPDLGRHIIEQLVDEEFDVASSSAIPKDAEGLVGIGHAFSFIYRRILRDKPIPLVPILINTFYPPNQAMPGRCLDFGQALGRAVKSWGSDKRVAILGSGGLSHFVIDEAWDRRMIDAMVGNDFETIRDEPNEIFRSGTSETKNWIVTLGAMSETDMKMEMLDYVPCYRSEAGTGNAMGFATWR